MLDVAPDRMDELYEALQGYAHTARRDVRLQVPPADSITVHNTSDGSQLTLQALIEDGRVQKLGYRVRACSLGQAATVILAQHAERLDLRTVRRVREQLEAILTGAAETSDWPQLEIFQLIRNVPNRHGAVLLPFQALEQLFERAAGKGSGSVGTDADTIAARE